MCAKKEMMISMDPQMAAKFSASTHVSRKLGIHLSFLTTYLFISLEGHFCKYAQGLLQEKKNTCADQG